MNLTPFSCEFFMSKMPYGKWFSCLLLVAPGSQVLGAVTASVSPASFAADTGATGSLKICLKNATNQGISGIGFNWTDYSGGTVIIGGSSTSPIPGATGSDGCVQTTISANSVPPNQSNDYILFSAQFPYESVPAAKLMLSAQWTLQATPTSIPGSGTSTATLTLSSNGFAQPGVLIVGSCPASGGASVALANAAILSNNAGHADFALTPSGFTPSSGNIMCSFSTPFPDAVTPAEVTVLAPQAVPDHLAFGVQPNDIPQGGRLDGVIVETLKSGSNALDTADSTTQVTLKTTTSVCGKLVSFGPVRAVSGIATFTDIGPHFYSITSTPLRLAASSSPSLAGVTSATFSVVPDPTNFIFASGLENCSL